MLAHEPLLRVVAFASVFLVLAALEVSRPRRDRHFSRLRRWRLNLGLVAFNTLVLRVVLPFAAVGVAASYQGGLLSWLKLGHTAELIVAWLLLDLAIWTQHLIAHRVPLLWRLHRVHHADVDFDLSTAVRFHPLEIGFSMLYKVMVIALLGPSAEAVLLFELSLSVFPLFNHANIALPLGLDRALRWLVVTPDMHRVHHSNVPVEMHSNFGFNVPWWDYLFGTYRAQPGLSHERMSLGLPDLNAEQTVSIGHALAMPFGHQPTE